MTVNGMNWTYGAMNDTMKNNVKQNTEFYSTEPFERLQKFFCVKPLVELFSHLTITQKIIVLNELRPIQASDLFQLLNEETQRVIIYELQKTNSFTLEQIALVGGEIFKNLPYLAGKQEKIFHQAKLLSNIIQPYNDDKKQEVLSYVEQIDESLLSKVKEQLKNDKGYI